MAVISGGSSLANSGRLGEHFDESWNGKDETGQECGLWSIRKADTFLQKVEGRQARCWSGRQEKKVWSTKCRRETNIDEKWIVASCKLNWWTASTPTIVVLTKSECQMIESYACVWLSTTPQMHQIRQHLPMLNGRKMSDFSIKLKNSILNNQFYCDGVGWKVVNEQNVQDSKTKVGVWRMKCSMRRHVIQTSFNKEWQIKHWNDHCFHHHHHRLHRMMKLTWKSLQEKNTHKKRQTEMLMPCVKWYKHTRWKAWIGGWRHF